MKNNLFYILLFSFALVQAQYKDIEELKEWDLSYEPPTYVILKHMMVANESYFYIENPKNGDRYQVFIHSEKHYKDPDKKDGWHVNDLYRINFQYEFSQTNTLFCKMSLKPAKIGDEEKVILYVDEWSACVRGTKDGKPGDRAVINANYVKYYNPLPDDMEWETYENSYVNDIKRAFESAMTDTKEQTQTVSERTHPLVGTWTFQKAIDFETKKEVALRGSTFFDPPKTITYIFNEDQTYVIKKTFPFASDNTTETGKWKVEGSGKNQVLILQKKVANDVEKKELDFLISKDAVIKKDGDNYYYKKVKDYSIKELSNNKLSYFWGDRYYIFIKE